MKKLFCLMLVLVCIASTALAAVVPSKTTADLTITVRVMTLDGENIDTLVVYPVPDTEEDRLVYGRQLDISKAEFAKLAEIAAQTGSVEEYFGELMNAEGELISLEAQPVNEAVNAEDAIISLKDKSIDEFMPVVVSGVETVSEESVLVIFNFVTVYELDENVVVLIGIVDPLTSEVAWTALEGTVTEDGGVMAEFTLEMLTAIQNGDAILAIASDTEAE